MSERFINVFEKYLLMERPAPTKQLLIEICGGNQGLISSIHHGLSESPLNQFYPVLDLDEVIAFAASSWKSREKDQQGFANTINRLPNAYALFSEVYKIGFPWLNKRKNVSLGLKPKYDLLNPFSGKDLGDRLGMVDTEDVEELKKRLLEPACEYVFQIQYHQRKMERGGDNYNLIVMNFQSVYPKAGVIVPKFASEIVRIISRYPRGQNWKREDEDSLARDEMTRIALDQFSGFRPLEPEEAYDILVPED